jgi:hypothetical protein
MLQSELESFLDEELQRLWLDLANDPHYQVGIVHIFERFLFLKKTRSERGVVFLGRSSSFHLLVSPRYRS